MKVGRFTAPDEIYFDQKEKTPNSVIFQQRSPAEGM